MQTVGTQTAMEPMPCEEHPLIQCLLANIYLVGLSEAQRCWDAACALAMPPAAGSIASRPVPNVLSLGPDSSRVDKIEGIGRLHQLAQKLVKAAPKNDRSAADLENDMAEHVHVCSLAIIYMWRAGARTQTAFYESDLSGEMTPELRND